MNDSTAARAGVLTWLLTRSTAFWVSAVTIILFVAFGVASRHGAFFGPASISGMLLDASTGLMLAVGMAYLLSAAQLDLSLGANIVLSSVVAVKVLVGLVDAGWQVAPAALVSAAASILTGVAFGVVNAFVVTRLRVNALIGTLGTGGIALGAVLISTNGVNIAGVPTELQRSFGTFSVGGVLPLPTLIALLICAVLWYVMRSTRPGVHIRAVGSSPEAATRNGISAPRVIGSLFVLIGGLGGLAGFFTIARFGTTNIGGSTDAALTAIAAAVIGGTSLFGGIVSIGGAMIGALLPIVLGSGLIVVGVQSFYQRVVVGVILILAVYVDQQRRSRREQSR